MISKENFYKILNIIKSGKQHELKQLKKDNLIECLKSVETFYKEESDNLKNLIDEHDRKQISSKELEESHARLEDTLKDYKNIIDDYKAEVDVLTQKLDETEENYLNQYEKSRNLSHSNWCLFILLIISLIINLIIL